MLTLFTGTGSRDCAGQSRRNFLQAGSLALGGLSLPWLLRARAESALEPRFVRDRAVVLVFLAGGASHIETFNPNMDGPEQSRSVTGEVKTTLPGVTFGGTFPLLAKLAKDMAIVRNFRHPVGAHAQAVSHVLTGGTDPRGEVKEGFGIGAMYARIRGANHPRTGLPTYHLLTNSHKDPQYGKELPRVAAGSRPGPLGPTFAPFTFDVPSGPPVKGKGGKTPAAGPLDSMQLKLPPDRLEDRRALLKRLDELKRGIDECDTAGGFGQFERQALDLLLGGASKAFDLSLEKKSLVERYDTSSFKCGKKNFEPSMLGKQLLLARRLVEAGAGFVTVQSAGWDMHADLNNPGMKEGMEMLGPLDRALSAFLADLSERGLSEKVLVVLTGDFGRTPKINFRGGRDHWANLCTLAFCGGGLKMGQVIGRSDRQNGKPDGKDYSAPNLLSTVMHALFDVGVLRVARGVPANLMKLISDHEPIAELLRMTPAIRLLQREKVPFTQHPYDHDESAESFGDEAATKLGIDASRVFKTLVCKAEELLIVLVPASSRLDLKALARFLGTKKVDLADPGVAERTTGYVIGGISPLGGRRALPAVIDESVTGLETVYVSAGRRGLQIELTPAELIRLTGARTAAVAG